MANEQQPSLILARPIPTPNVVGQLSGNFLSHRAYGNVRWPASQIIAGHIFSSRTLLTKYNIVPGFIVPGSNIDFQPLQLIWQAADPYFGNRFLASNKDYAYSFNSQPLGGNFVSVTLKSYPEPSLNRLGDKTVILRPQEYYVFGPITKTGWMYPADGCIYLDAQTTDIQYLIMTYA